MEWDRSTFFNSETILFDITYWEKKSSWDGSDKAVIAKMNESYYSIVDPLKPQMLGVVHQVFVQQLGAHLLGTIG